MSYEPGLTQGCYVTYKGTKMLIVTEKPSKVTLINPLVGNAKVTVLKTNVITTNHRPAVIVAYKMARYIVTALGCIISVKTGKVMKWDDTDDNKLAILKLSFGD